MESKNWTSVREPVEASPAMRWLARRRLQQIAQHLLTFPRDITDESPAVSYNMCSRSKNFGNVGLVALKDGVAVLYTTQGVLADRSHRFVFPDKGPIRYHRDSFNVDVQAIASPGVNLEGIDEIAGHREGARQVFFIVPPIEAGTRMGWEHLERSISPAAHC